MKPLSWSEFKTLSESASDYSVSIYLPTHVAGPEIQQDSIRLKNLLGEAEAKLLEAGAAKGDVDNLLKEAAALLDDERFWRHQSQGLALFLTPSATNIYRLPLEFESLVVVGDRFHLKPLLPLFFDNRYFYILALSQNQVRFFQATRYQISEISLEDVPLSLEEALKYDDPEKQLQFHSTSRSGTDPVYHGQGVGTTDEKDKETIERFLNKVNDGLQAYLNTEDAPLVVASVDFIHSIYQSVNTYSNVVGEAIYGNPDVAQPDDLREAAWPKVAKRIEQSHDDALNQYNAVMGTGKASDRLSHIVLAACRGQVDTLFVQPNVYRWGTVDAPSSQVDVHDSAQPKDSDLLDIAAVQTALQSGTVFTLNESAMPNAAEIAAIYRYEVPTGA